VRVDSGTFVTILSFATFVFAVVGVAGTWRASKSTSALNSYRDTAQAWEAKAQAQAMQIKDLEDDSARNKRLIAELEGKVAVLSDTLTGKAAWEILEGKISEALVLIAETRGEVRQVARKLDTT
jgi:hypothetical protein